MPQITPLIPEDPRRLGRFHLTGRIGEGGQGVVYLGEGDAGERVAVKLFHIAFRGDAKARSRFARELRASQRVASFCTARVVDADIDGDAPYIASEFIDGRSLAATVASDGPMTGTALDRLAIGTATALTAIHHASIVHRDFKPDNVLMAADGPRVIDFGIARLLDTHTITSRAVGTPAYLAPEQVSGGETGTFTDVFSWGATIMFAATGGEAFGGRSIASVLNRILNHEVDTSHLHEPLRGTVTAALAKNPAQRPTADQVLLRLLGRPDTGGASPAVLTQGVRVATPQRREPHRDTLPSGPDAGENGEAEGTGETEDSEGSAGTEGAGGAGVDGGGSKAPPTVPLRRPYTPLPGRPSPTAGSSRGDGTPGLPAEVAGPMSRYGAAVPDVEPPAQAGAQPHAEPPAQPHAEARRRPAVLWTAVAVLALIVAALVVAALASTLR
ncbi:Serine/threonine protein kinase [Sinosporangium album]|uniref:Serine/threonine protein kinase n=1 Tax=Sinosporangium album TaxID=504805 RepID=A0A1G8CWJ6_9ACTN|nr:serine/threonine-protein kinase [Sinosporangium album]SDH49573.1 Serine/threonine protein kinase [Sinosporangium album]